MAESTSARTSRPDRAPAVKLTHVVKVEPLDDFRLRLLFDDGLVKVVDLSDDLWGPMFEPLRDPDVFRQVRVDDELGTIIWPNGVDMDPIVLRGDLPAAPNQRS